MKKIITISTIITLLVISLFTMTGCENKENNQSITNNAEKNETNEAIENKSENTTDNTVANKDENKNTPKEIDKTPININDSKSYFFVVKGKKYYSGDKISDLTSSEFTFNKTGSEKEIPVNGYLIGGGSVQNSDKHTVFSVTAYNNTKEKIKGSDAVIGGFNLDKYGYDYLSGDIEIFGGITIGTSIDDVKAVFGEPSKKTEETQYSGPSYTYDAEARYREFVFNFDKEGKVKSLSWRNFNF